MEVKMLIGSHHIEIPDSFNVSTRNTVEVICAAREAMFYEQDYLIETLLQSLLIQEAFTVTCMAVDEHDFDMDQEQFCHECEAAFVAFKLPEFMQLITRHISHGGYNVEDIGISVDDMRVAASLVYLEEFSDEYEQYIEEQMATEYERPKRIK